MKLTMTRNQYANIGFAVWMFLCMGLAVWLRWPGLDPFSLFLDDQWVACLLKLGGASAVPETGAPTPLGFVLLLQMSTKLGADPEWPLQIVPFACSLLLIPLMGVLARRVTGGTLAGCLAALILVFSPDVNLYAVRVKQYTLECAATLGILLLAWRWMLSRGIGRFTVLAGTSLALFLFAFTAMPAGFAAVNLLFLAALRDSSSRTRRWPYLAVCLAFDALLFLAWLALVRGQSNQAMHSFWAGYFPPLDSLSQAWEFFRNTGVRFFSGILPGRLAWAALLVPLGLTALIRRQKTRLMGLLVLLLYGEIWVLAALRLYPVGTGRTDIFAYPVTILCLASAFLLIPGNRGRTFAMAIGSGALCLALLVLYGGERTHYFNNEDKGLVEYLNQAITPDDALVIYPQAQWAVGYYGKWPITAERSQYFAHNFEVRLNREHTLLLPGGKDGVPYLEAPEIFEPELRQFLREPYETLFFIATNQPPHVEELILSAIATARPVKDIQMYRSRNRAALYKIQFEQPGTAAE